MTNPTYTIYTDGASRGNPGPAGSGAIGYCENGAEMFRVSKFLGNKTNNQAEYEAVFLGLVELKKRAKDIKDVVVEIKMDSELVARQIKGEYQVKEPTLFPLYISIHNFIVKEKPSIIVTHIPREENKEADKLANIGIDKNGR